MLNDLDRAIRIHRSVLILTPADEPWSREARPRDLEGLLERRSQMVSDCNSAIGFLLLASDTVPRMLESAKDPYEIITDRFGRISTAAQYMHQKTEA
jgi:hypothetical protein